MLLKRDPKQRCKFAENVETVKPFPFAGFIELFCPYSCETSISLLQIGAPQGTGMFAHSLWRKSRKNLIHDVTDTSATHTGLLRDVTGTDCRAQNGSAQGRAFTSVSYTHLTLPTKLSV